MAATNRAHADLFVDAPRVDVTLVITVTPRPVELPPISPAFMDGRQIDYIGNYPWKRSRALMVTTPQPSGS
ncbi:hypothetical protein OG799_19380 [Micromonospora sp. NBC_00898]|uniref:hypothetical protein n=1 Tax=Micromonospora sp. NBC_00898 TaxID=2975981 RepID=UPI003870D578|nr:hypothetical protein OG799_19380 [Micromonospora sp. NBC_00898]